LARFICAAMLAFSANFASAQSVEPPRRPKLEAKADTNDWESYYDYGIRVLRTFPQRSYEAFYWASRLAPWTADPLYAQWVAFHLRNIRRFERYLDDDSNVLMAPDVQRVDSALALAFLRNPFVHRALETTLWEALGVWGSSLLIRAWGAYGSQKLDKATEMFGRAIAEKPEKLFRYRQVRAVLFVAAKQYDSALAEMTAVVDETRRRDQKELVREYESKAYYEYAIGRLESARSNPKAAREAYERALVEDLAYAPAHIALALMADEERNHTSALTSFAQAVEIRPSDPVYRYQFAVALMKAGRMQEGLDQIERVIVLEPYFAEPYLFKGAAHEQLGKPDSARLAYQLYLDRAPRNAPNRAHATRRVAALESGPPSR
jgi:tetratricopeptide (TPR) repeat protein